MPERARRSPGRVRLGGTGHDAESMAGDPGSDMRKEETRPEETTTPSARAAAASRREEASHAWTWETRHD